MSAIPRPDRSDWFLRRSNRATALGGVLWILTLEFFVAQAIAQAAWTTPYSPFDNAISDLGVTSCGAVGLGSIHRYLCSPLHAVMNASFIVTGVLIALGLALTSRAWPRRRLTTWGFAFLAAAAIGKIVVGLAPENVDLPLHVFGGLGIPCASVGVLLLGLAVRRARPWIGNLSLLLAIGGLAGLLVDGALLTAGHGHGVGERLADYPAFVWMVVLGTAFVVWVGRTEPVAPITGRTPTAAR